VITSHDVQLASQGPAGTRVREICLRETYVVELTEPLDRVLLRMSAQHLDSALVVKDGKLVGIFTISDACRAFGELLRTLFPSGGDNRIA
jgi:CBS domain-containing protein